MLRIFLILAVVAVSVGMVVVWSRLSAPSAEQQLNDCLDRFERIESARLTAAAGNGEAVRVTVTLDSIDAREDADYPLLAVVHVKREGREYARPCLIYNRAANTWEWEQHSAAAVAASTVPATVRSAAK